MPEQLTREYARQSYAPAETMVWMVRHLDESYGGVTGHVRSIGLAPERFMRIRDRFVG